MSHPSHDSTPSRPRRRAVRIFALLLTALLLTVAAGGAFLMTSAGRSFVLARAIPILSQSLDQTIHIKKTGGVWPRDIDLIGVTVSDTKGIWLEIDHLHLTWRPFALLRGRINIDSLRAGDVHLVRLPAGQPEPPATPPSRPDLNAIRHTLDDVQVDDLTIDALRVESDVFGNPATIAVKATLKAEESVPTLTIILDRRDAPGTAGATLKLGDNTVSLSARVAIAGIDLDAGAAMSGESEALSGSVRGSCGGGAFCVKWASGSIGAVTGEATLGGTRAKPRADVAFHIADLKDTGRSLDKLDGVLGLIPDIESQTLRLDGRGTLGGLKRTVPEAGTVLGNDGAWSLSGAVKSGTVVLGTLTVKAGDTEAILTGTLTGANLSGASLFLNLRGAGRLAGLNDPASETHAELKIAKGTIAPNLTATGSVTVGVKNLPAEALPSPAFNTPLKFSSSFVLSRERLTFGNLAGLWGPGTFKGESIFARNRNGEDHLTTTATLTIAPNAFAAQSKPIQINAALTGGLATLNAMLSATLDEYQRGAARISAIETTVQVKRDPQGWKATLRSEAKINDAAVALTATVNQTPTDIVVDSIHLIGAGADLNGEARLAKSRSVMTGTLAGPVGDLAPWTIARRLSRHGPGRHQADLGG